jgi:hypothetical protein
MFGCEDCEVKRSGCGLIAGHCLRQFRIMCRARSSSSLAVVSLPGLLDELEACQSFSMKRAW